MKFSRSWAIAVWAAIALVSDAASAQSFPSRPITVIMPFAGGSASDVVSRVLFNKMATILGQPIVVENKPGDQGIPVGSSHGRQRGAEISSGDGASGLAAMQV
jgi:tripartite-type tricarboxylate transporter receptor subunit TctC